MGNSLTTAYNYRMGSFAKVCQNLPKAAIGKLRKSSFLIEYIADSKLDFSNSASYQK